MPNPHDYDKRKKALEDQMKGLEAERARADKLWAEHGQPLSHDDRVLLHRLLHEYLHGED